MFVFAAELQQGNNWVFEKTEDNGFLRFEKVQMQFSDFTCGKLREIFKIIILRKDKVNQQLWPKLSCNV